MTNYRIGFLGLAALLLGFGPVPLDIKKILFQTCSFYFIFVAVAIWFWTLLPKSPSIKIIQSHLPALCLALIFITTIFFISPTHLRILYDETNLLGVSQAMLEQHACYIPTQAIFVNQQNHLIAPEWGIRPLAFPFFLYIIHLINGYALSNVYLLNAIAGFFALFLFYLLLQNFFSKTLAILGMALLAAYPVFALWTTSGGFEIANLTLALLAFYQLYHLFISQQPYHATRLFFTLIILAQMRYEAVLFLCAILPFAIYHSIKYPQAPPHKIALITPFLLLPVAWQRSLYSGDYAFMVKEGEAMFGIHHFITNLFHAYSFFGGAQSDYGTIPYLFYLTLAGILIGFIHLHQNRSRIPYATRTIIFIACLAFALQAIIILGYILGNLTRPFSIRLGIIFLPFLITPIIYLCHLITNKKPVLIAPIILWVCIILFYGGTHTFQNASVSNFHLVQINRAYTDFFQDQDPQKQALIISPYARLFVADQRSAVTFSYANQNWQEIINHLHNNMYNKIYICQIAHAQTHVINNDTRLSHPLSLNPFGELQIGNEIHLISQITITK